MKRSGINQIIRETLRFLDASQFYLPEWSRWTLPEWQANRGHCRAIFERCLGWDVTDSGGDFDTNGLVLFTIRNGIARTERAYCEKIIVMKPGQVCPYHHHVEKTEDIINRSEHDIAFQIYDERMPDEVVRISIDAIEHTIESRSQLILHSGQSLTLSPFYTHRFWPVDNVVLIGEVSSANDDQTDNIFAENATRRFPDIQEDEEILYPIVGDYPQIAAS